MTNIDVLSSIKRLGTGLAFMIFPLIFVFAFATHPGLLNPHILNPQELIQRAHKNDLLQLGHALVTLNTGLLVVVALHFMRVLQNSSLALFGFVGGLLAVFGSLILAVDKGALCLTMSAIDTLPESDFAQMMPGLLAMFNKKGWLVLLWALPLLPLGFAFQAIALFKARILPRWQSILFLVGSLLIAIPDGIEIVNLTAAILMAIAFVPYGIKLISKPL